jgi:hypothetical protein
MGPSQLVSCTQGMLSCEVYSIYIKSWIVMAKEFPETTSRAFILF